MAHKFISAVRQRSSRLAERDSAPTSVNHTSNQPHLLRRRSGLELTGAFLFIALLIAGGASLHADNSTTSGNGNDPNAPANGSTVQLTQTDQSSSLPANNSNANDSSSSSSTQTTTVTSTNTNGNASTKVTINGKPVSVPANGSKTVTNGDSTTTISNNTSGTASNNVNADTNVNVSGLDNSISNNTEVTPLMPY